MNLRLTNSELSTYRQCKRKWWLGTYRRLTPKVQAGYGSALHVGNVVHDALAAYYDPETDVTDPWTHAEAYYYDQLLERPEYEFEIEKEKSLVQPMLIGYKEFLEETGADSDLRLLGSERMVEVPMTDEITLLSKLDAPVEQLSDGAQLVLEHKTVGDLESPLNLLKIDTQLLTEHLVRFLDAQAKGATPEEAYDQCHGILYNMLKKNKRTSRAKPPFYGRLIIPHNLHELRNHWLHVLATAREIQSTRASLDGGVSHHSVVPPSPAKDCTWKCEFFRVCPLFDDGSRVEEALEVIYEERDPLERYEGAEKL